jgi:hypothetical protein
MIANNKQEFLDMALDNVNRLTDEQLEILSTTKHVLALQTGIVVFCCHGIRNALSDFWDTPKEAFSQIPQYLWEAVGNKVDEWERENETS